MRLAAAALVLLLAGCGDDGFDASDMGAAADIDSGPLAAPMDNGAEGSTDASPPDGSVPDRGIPVETAEYDTSRGALAAFDCFDETDNDDNGLTDCADRACRENVRACCVGESTPDCCFAEPPDELPALAACGGDWAACTAVNGLPAIGALPQLVSYADEASLTPGDPDADSGVFLAEVHDLRRSALIVSARLAVSPESTTEGALAVGLVPAGDDGERIRPVAALAVRGDEGSVSLVLRGTRVQSWAVPDGAFRDFEITARPDRTLRVALRLQSGGEALLSDGLTLPEDVGPLRVAVYGRADVAEPSVFLSRLAARAQSCDIPDAVQLSPTPVFPASDASDELRARRAVEDPQLFRADGALWLAAAIDREIYLAREEADGTFTLDGTLREPALVDLSAEWAEDGVGDPNVVVDDTGGRTLYFTGRLGDAVTVARAPFDSSLGRFDGRLAEVLLQPAEGDEIRAYDDPFWFSIDGEELLAVREGTAMSTRIRLYLWDGGAFVPNVGMLDLAPSGDFGGFDRDEVAEPAVVVVGGVVRLYYAARRGTRWGIGLDVSENLLGWRSLGEVIAPRGLGFDAIGVRAPAPIVEGDELRVYYVGDEGGRTRIGRATGRVPPLP